MLRLFRGSKGSGDGPRDPDPPEPLEPTDKPELHLPTREEAPDAALETLGQLLRHLGEDAFAVAEETEEKIRTTFGAWSRHILVLAPSPENPDEPARRRDFMALRRFVAQFRKREAGYVRRTLTDLRSVLWLLVGQLGSAVLSDRASDGEATEQLLRLQRTVNSGSVDDLKREAHATVDKLHHLIAERRSREAQQVASLRERIQTIHEELAQTRQALALDPLTKLFNRAALDERLERTACLSALTCQDAGLLMVDIDNFKRVNDTYGHPVGDQVIKAVADVCVRAFPREWDFVARYGGEEFTIIAADAQPTSLELLSERVLSAVRKLSIEAMGTKITVTVSVGATSLVPGEQHHAWMRRADAALYQAKQAGRDRAVIAPKPA